MCSSAFVQQYDRSSNGSLLSSWCVAMFTCRKPLALKQDVEVQLDEHFSIKFTRGYELQLFFTCEGCQMGVSLLHGAMLPGSAEADCLEAVQQHSLAGKARSLGSAAAGVLASGANNDAAVAVTSSGSEVARAAAAAAAATDGTKDLLARARALMAADFSDLVVSSSDAGAEEGSVDIPSSGTCTASGMPAAATAEDLSTQELLARARVLMASDNGS
jgi:hypothetical protein